MVSTSWLLVLAVAKSGCRCSCEDGVDSAEDDISVLVSIAQVSLNCQFPRSEVCPYHSGFIVAAAIASLCDFYRSLSGRRSVQIIKGVSMTVSAGNDDETNLWHELQVKVAEALWSLGFPV